MIAIRLLRSAARGLLGLADFLAYARWQIEALNAAEPDE